MQLYVAIYFQSRYSTCFGCHAPIIRSTKNCICYHWCTSWQWYRYFLPPWPDPDYLHTAASCWTFINIESWCMEPCVKKKENLVIYIYKCFILHKVAIYLSFNDRTKSDEDRRAQYQTEQGCADNTQVTPDKHHEFPQFKLNFMLVFCKKKT